MLGVPGPQGGGCPQVLHPSWVSRLCSRGLGLTDWEPKDGIPLGEDENGPDIAMICRVAGWRVVMSSCILQFAFENGNYRA